MRAIATRAGVDPALVHHYFGTKEQLFLAVMEIPFDPAEVVATIGAGPRGETGVRVARTFLQVWGDPARRAPLLALLRSAMGHATAAAMMRQFIAKVLLPKVAAALGDVPDRELRAELMISHLLGAAMLRYVLKVEPIASTPDEELVAAIGAVIQHYVTDAEVAGGVPPVPGVSGTG